MRLYIKTAASFLIAAFFISCVQQQREKPAAGEKTLAKKDAANRIEVRLLGVLETRRSYANIQFMVYEIKNRADAFCVEQSPDLVFNFL